MPDSGETPPIDPPQGPPNGSEDEASSSWQPESPDMWAEEDQERPAWQPDDVSGNTTAEETEHLERVFRAYDVGVADQQQRWDLQRGEPLLGDRHADPIELVVLDDQ